MYGKAHLTLRRLPQPSDHVSQFKLPPLSADLRGLRMPPPSLIDIKFLREPMNPDGNDEASMECAEGVRHTGRMEHRNRNAISVWSQS